MHDWKTESNDRKYCKRCKVICIYTDDVHTTYYYHLGKVMSRDEEPECDYLFIRTVMKK
jgi:hypothetical protein